MGAPDRLLVGVSGSVSVLALPSYLYAFRAAGIGKLAVLLTRTAESFLPASSVRLLADGVYTESEHGPGHVALARWADRTLVLPATAHLLACAAVGLAPSLLTTVLLAAEGPVVFVPAMNPAMWSKPVVQRNVERLREEGHQVLEPEPGESYEVASRAIVPGLTLPSADTVLKAVTG